jgi:hypothetical protein
MGTSPRELYHAVFNIIDKEVDFGEVKHVLYCKSYGGYDYSDEFKTFLEKHVSRVDLDELNREIYPYIIQFAESTNLSINEALKRASGDYCKLTVKVVPRHRKYIIREYDGCESVQVLNDFV